MSRDLAALVDISDAIQLINQYIDGVDRYGLSENVEKQDAIIRRITIIGEATKRLSKEFRSQHPTIPWKQIAGMRVAHQLSRRHLALLKNELRDRSY